LNISRCLGGGSTPALFTTRYLCVYLCFCLLTSAGSATLFKLYIASVHTVLFCIHRSIARATIALRRCATSIYTVLFCIHRNTARATSVHTVFFCIHRSTVLVTIALRRCATRPRNGVMPLSPNSMHCQM